MYILNLDVKRGEKMKKKACYPLILTLLLIYLSCLTASAEILGGLNQNEFTIKLFGWPLNLTPALNIKLSFSDPGVAKLSSASPSFEAQGTSLLLSSSDVNNNTISILRTEEIIPNNEMKIKVKVDPGLIMGATEITIDKIEAAGGFDITDSIITQIDPPLITNTKGVVISELGSFTLLDPGKLIAPGDAAIAFKIVDTPNIISAEVNGNPVDFIGKNTGIAIVDLPKDKSKSILSLTVYAKGKSDTMHLGDLKIDKGISIGLPPRIRKAIAVNEAGNTKFKLIGRKFGIKRFGKDDVDIEVIPINKSTTNDFLKKRSFKDRLTDNSCIPYGSYVNISHPGGTRAKKIDVIGNCN